MKVNCPNCLVEQNLPDKKYSPFQRFRCAHCNSVYTLGSAQKAASRIGAAETASRSFGNGEVDIVCPHCGEEYVVERDALGSRVQCENCGRHFFASQKFVGASPTTNRKKKIVFTVAAVASVVGVVGVVAVCMLTRKISLPSQSQLVAVASSASANNKKIASCVGRKPKLGGFMGERLGEKLKATRVRKDTILGEGWFEVCEPVAEIPYFDKDSCTYSVKLEKDRVIKMLFTAKINASSAFKFIKEVQSRYGEPDMSKLIKEVLSLYGESKVCEDCEIFWYWRDGVVFIIFLHKTNGLWVACQFDDDVVNRAGLDFARLKSEKAEEYRELKQMYEQRLGRETFRRIKKAEEEASARLKSNYL